MVSASRPAETVRHFEVVLHTCIVQLKNIQVVRCTNTRKLNRLGKITNGAIKTTLNPVNLFYRFLSIPACSGYILDGYRGYLSSSKKSASCTSAYLTVRLLNSGKQNFQSPFFILKPPWCCSSASPIQYLGSIVKIGHDLAILSAVEDHRHCVDFERERAKYQ